MVAPTASIGLRAAPDVRIVSIALFASIGLFASMALLVWIVPSIRPCLRERRNDGQSKNDGSDEDGLAKNISSRFHCHCSSLRAREASPHTISLQISVGRRTRVFTGSRRREFLLSDTW